MVSVGYSSACAVLNDDSVKCLGSNGAAEFGTGNQLPSADNLPTSTALPAGLTAKSVSTCETESISYGTVCAVMNDDSIWCWGYNGQGLAGVGDEDTYILVPTRVCFTADDCAAPSGPPGPPGNDGSPGAAGAPGLPLRARAATKRFTCTRTSTCRGRRVQPVLQAPNWTRTSTQRVTRWTPRFGGSRRSRCWRWPPCSTCSSTDWMVPSYNTSSSR